ncbi:hypothetical protein DL95DRAFT_448687 [Leptodontidium sp. 2 PMI_412]|nr:hypothetical protein BKA61DRAFT_624605 [Leptodontidium sp. MPI-SDFR-AT-0119]KAH9210636.1 hypothetical protein DL95DRAFT_448687 [Leptodontidium sp. 2 PMI_412]
MSFGWSAGDIIAAINLLLEITQALNSATGSPSDHKRASSFIAPITNSLQALHSYAAEEEDGLSASGLNEKKVSTFRPTIEALEPLIKEFTEKVMDYSGLNDDGKRKRDWFKRQYEKLKWHFVEREDLLKLRTTIEAHFAVLGALYPKLIINVVEFHESKSAERDADILGAVNTSSEGIGEIYRLLTHMWELQQMSAGNLLKFGPDAGVGTISEVKAEETDEVVQSHISDAILLVQPHIQESMTEEFAGKASRMNVDGPVIRKLKTWLSEPSLSRLWLFGPKSTTLSAIVFDTARKRHRPIAAYPCRHINHAGSQNTEEDILVGLVYSFIYQLLQQLLPGTILDGWTRKEKFAVLNGTLDSVSECILFIRVLLRAIPGCTCIIDGFHNLGHSEDLKIKSSLDDLLAVFEEGVGRLLLTSSGPNPLLAGCDKGHLDRLDISKWVDAGRFVLSAELMSVTW